MKKTFILEFDYPIKIEDKIIYRHNKEKVSGTDEEVREHLNFLKTYGTMKNIKLKEVI